VGEFEDRLIQRASVGLLAHTPRNSSEREILRALASFSMLTSATLRSPRSIPPTRSTDSRQWTWTDMWPSTRQQGRFAELSEPRKVLPKQEACPDCGGKLKHLGEDVSEILEYVPASLKVIQYVRPKLACACCDRIVQAEAPSRPIERSIAGPGLLAHVLASKYCDHLPLYRQSQIFARTGVELDRSTLAEWVGGSSRLLRPLVEALRRHVMAAGKLHADDTPVPVLAPGLGKTKTGRLWTYVRDDRPAGDSTPAAVWFAYSPDRKGEHPQSHLSNFTGTLQADAYAGFEQIYEAGRIQEAACWAHVRRKFYDLEVAHKSPTAAKALERIAGLYAIEKEIRGRPPDERREVRNTRSRPLLESLKQWNRHGRIRFSREFP
jgi:transposase